MARAALTYADRAPDGDLLPRDILKWLTLGAVCFLGEETAA
jgi:hypothetical protein